MPITIAGLSGYNLIGLDNVTLVPFPAPQPELRVVDVRVNGQAVEALDAAGNFFSTVQVRPGQNTFEVVATDAFNQSTTNSITVFAVNARNGKLANVQNVSTQGHIPRGMAIDPEGTHLLAANQNSDNIVIFDRDAKTGKLTPTGQVMTDIPTAVCILFTPID